MECVVYVCDDVTVAGMAYRKRHMFCVLFHVVLITIAVADVEQPADVNVSDSPGVFLVLSRISGF